MSLRLLPVTAAVVVLAGGCGGGGHHDRDAVVRYITSVNTVQVELARPARSVSAAVRELTRPAASHARVGRTLTTAAGRIDALRRRLAAIPAPPTARKLRARLLELLRDDARMARELAAYAVFVPAFQAAVRPLAPAGARLERELSKKQPAVDSAAALEAYATQIADVEGRLRALNPPPVSAPERDSELRTLESLQSATRALAAGLRARHASQLAALIHRFDAASIGNTAAAAQRSRISAIRAYNRRVRNLATLAVLIQRERAHLQATLG